MGGIRPFHRLDDAVGRSGGHLEPRRRPAHGLVVAGAHVDARPPVDAVEPAAGHQLDGVDRPRPSRVAGDVGDRVAVDIGDVLDQVAAQGDVEHLHAAADAQERDAFLHGQAGDGQLEGVAAGVDPGHQRVGFGTEVTRVHVAAPGEDHAVDPAQDRLRGRPVGHQDHGDAARLPHGGDVVARDEQAPALVPAARRHTDEGSGQGDRLQRWDARPSKAVPILSQRRARGPGEPAALGGHLRCRLGQVAARDGQEGRRPKGDGGGVRCRRRMPSMESSEFESISIRNGK